MRCEGCVLRGSDKKRNRVREWRERSLDCGNWDEWGWDPLK